MVKINISKAVCFSSRVPGRIYPEYCYLPQVLASPDHSCHTHSVSVVPQTSSFCVSISKSLFLVQMPVIRVRTTLLILATKTPFFYQITPCIGRSVLHVCLVWDTIQLSMGGIQTTLFFSPQHEYMTPCMAMHTIFYIYSQIREAKKTEEQAIKCGSLLMPCVLFFIVVVLCMVSLTYQVLKLLFQFPIGTCFSVS